MKYLMNKMKLNWKVLFLFGLMICGIVVSIARSTNIAIEGDEAYSMLLSRGSFGYMIEETAADVHPPLYYFILKLGTIFVGENIFLLRVLSVVPIMILLLVGISFIRKEFGSLTAAVFMSLVSFPPSISVRYHTELRMYSFAMTLIVLCVLFAYDIYTRNTSCKKMWIGFVATGVAAAYLHYYALITVAFIYGGLFLFLIIENRKRVKECAICSVVTILLYLPWLPILIQQFNRTTENYWIGPITKSVLAGYYRFAFGSETLGFLFGLITVILFIITFVTKDGIHKYRVGDKNGVEITISFKWIRKLSPSKKLVLLCLAGFAGNIFTGITLSLIFRPIFSERYIYVGLGLLWLAIGIMACEAIKSMKGVCVVLVLFLLCAGVGNYREIYEREQIKSANTIDTVRIMKEQMSSEDIISSNIQHFTWTILQYHFPTHDIKVVHDIDWGKNSAAVWYLEDSNGVLIPILEKQNNLEIENKGEYFINEIAFSLYRISRK